MAQIGDWRGTLDVFGEKVERDATSTTCVENVLAGTLLLYPDPVASAHPSRAFQCYDMHSRCDACFLWLLIPCFCSGRPSRF